MKSLIAQLFSVLKSEPLCDKSRHITQMNEISKMIILCLILKNMSFVVAVFV